MAKSVIDTERKEKDSSESSIWKFWTGQIPEGNTKGEKMNKLRIGRSGQEIDNGEEDMDMGNPDPEK